MESKIQNQIKNNKNLSNAKSLKIDILDENSILIEEFNLVLQ